MMAFIKAAFLVVVAEMGDKTQLLAMAMASKYTMAEVYIGVFIATVFNHALAVVAGSYLAAMLPMNLIKIVAAISFLNFGLWTLRGDKLEEEGSKKSKFGPIMSVALAFFIAEMGDKTQLMTVTIAADLKEPIAILLGTTLGMMIADGIGIVGGAWMSKNIPESYIKWISGFIFIIFGTRMLYNHTPNDFLTPFVMMLYIGVMILCIYFVGIKYAYSNQVKPSVTKRKNII